MLARAKIVESVAHNFYFDVGKPRPTGYINSKRAELFVVDQHLHRRHGRVRCSCVARQSVVFDGDEGIDDMSAQGGVDVLRQKRLAAVRRSHREVAHSLVGESCNKTSPLRFHFRKTTPVNGQV